MLRFYICFSFCLFLTSSTGFIVSTDNVSQDKGMAWWKKVIFYQVYPRSFKDSDGDGVGDLPGILSKVDYFKDLGVGCVWLSPFYPSPMVDFGYDISDQRNVDPMFGNLTDFDNIVKALHDRGIRIIVDFVPGHVSTEHEWFKKSVRREGKYTDYFVWNDGKLDENGTRIPPDNWLSVFGYSAWEWVEERGQYYYHAYTVQQADLNYRNCDVQSDIKTSLRFWLDRGVDGFRIDAISQLYEVENVSINEPLSGRKGILPFQYDYTKHVLQEERPEIIPTVTSWFRVLEEYHKRDGNIRYLVIETYAGVEDRNKLYKTGGNPFNFDLTSTNGNNASYTFGKIMNEYDNTPPGRWPNFVLGNHDLRRVSEKYGHKYVDALNILLLTLRGTPTSYYGEELGMISPKISWNQTVDPWGRNFGKENFMNFTRDPQRTPMQWDNTTNAGFTSGNETWLPIHSSYKYINVETMKTSRKQTSLKLYMALAQVRSHEPFLSGPFKPVHVDNELLIYTRSNQTTTQVVALNLGVKKGVISDFKALTGSNKFTVMTYTPSINWTQSNNVIVLDKLSLFPGDGLVLRLESN